VHRWSRLHHYSRIILACTSLACPASPACTAGPLVLHHEPRRLAPPCPYTGSTDTLATVTAMHVPAAPGYVSRPADARRRCSRTHQASCPSARPQRRRSRLGESAATARHSCADQPIRAKPAHRAAPGRAGPPCGARVAARPGPRGGICGGRLTGAGSTWTAPPPHRGTAAPRGWEDQQGVGKSVQVRGDGFFFHSHGC
jgi:hypothetical protein